MTTKDIFKSIERQALAYLCESGPFLKRGKVATLRIENVCFCVGLSTGRFSLPQAYDFWPEVTVGFVDAPLTSFTKKSLVDGDRVIIIDRLSSFLGLKARPWVIRGDSDADAVSRDLCAAELLPLLETLRGITNTASFLEWIDERADREGRHRYAFSIATALAKADRMEEARRYFRRAEGASAMIEAVMRRYGLAPNED